MAELKTKKNKRSVKAFLASVKDMQKRKDAEALVKIFKSITKDKPVMWGTSIIGFGSYHYKSERSSQEGDWPITGFSPRKQNLTLYVMPGFKKYGALLKKLGKCKTSVGCLYINKLSDIHLPTLKQLITVSVRDMKKKYQ
jgi:hypothetical protein